MKRWTHHFEPTSFNLLLFPTQFRAMAVNSRDVAMGGHRTQRVGRLPDIYEKLVASAGQLVVQRRHTLQHKTCSQSAQSRKLSLLRWQRSGSKTEFLIQHEQVQNTRVLVSGG